MRRAAIALCLLVFAGGCLALPPEEGPESGPPTSGDGVDLRETAGEGELAVHAVDVGQADATLVVGPTGDTVLVDTGGWQDDGETVIEYLEARGVERVDHLVSTHGHADHVGGAAEVIDHFETERDGVGAVWDSGVATTSQTYADYLDAIEAHDVTLYEARAGDELEVEGASVVVLHPEAVEGDDLHRNGLAVRVGHGDAAFLFTGDAERDVEGELVERHGDRLRATGLQAGHHGSDSSNGPAFLEAVDPAFVVVSSAHDSQYGHPHDEVVARVDDAGADLYWTGVHGTVVARSDGDVVTVATAADAPTAPLAAYEAAAADVAPTAPVAVRETYDANRTAAGAVAGSAGATTGSPAAAPAAAGGGPA